MKYSLPYINNAKAVLITVAINLGVVFVFHFPNGINLRGVVADTFLCAFITTMINMWIVYASVIKIRRAGKMPQQVPISGLMQRLPKNPVALGVIYAFAFAATTIAINWLILTFFDMSELSFIPWMTYKLIYSTILSIKIVEFCIFRYVQPDWAKERQENTLETVSRQPVKNPFPKISLIKEMYGSVTGNIAMNVIIGTVLGGVVAQADGSVVIFPTTQQGIPITGVIFGLIVGILATNGVVKSIKEAIFAADSAMLESLVRDKRFSWMPKRIVALMCLTAVCAMLFSAVALPALMYLFEKPFLNFYQFTLFITVYASLIVKPISYVLIRRCMQPDFVSFTLERTTNLSTK